MFWYILLGLTIIAAGVGIAWAVFHSPVPGIASSVKCAAEVRQCQKAEQRRMAQRDPEAELQAKKDSLEQAKAEYWDKHLSIEIVGQDTPEIVEDPESRIVNAKKRQNYENEARKLVLTGYHDRDSRRLGDYSHNTLGDQEMWLEACEKVRDEIDAGMYDDRLSEADLEFNTLKLDNEIGYARDYKAIHDMREALVEGLGHKRSERQDGTTAALRILKEALEDCHGNIEGLREPLAKRLERLPARSGHEYEEFELDEVEDILMSFAEFGNIKDLYRQLIFVAGQRDAEYVSLSEYYFRYPTSSVTIAANLYAPKDEKRKSGKDAALKLEEQMCKLHGEMVVKG